MAPVGEISGVAAPSGLTTARMGRDARHIILFGDYRDRIPTAVTDLSGDGDSAIGTAEGPIRLSAPCYTPGFWRDLVML